MKEQEKAPMPQHTKNDSSDVERVEKDKEKVGKEGTATSSPPPEPGKTKEEEEAEKGHS